MKSYEELEANAYKKAEMIISRQKHCKLIMLRSGAIGLGAAAVLGIGIFTNVMKPPKRPTPDQPGIITESSETVTTSEVAATETTAVNTTAIATSTKATTSKASNSDVQTSSAAKTTAYITVAVTNKTTAVTAKTTGNVQSGTTSVATTASAMTTVRPATTTRSVSTTTGFEPEATGARPQVTTTVPDEEILPSLTSTAPQATTTVTYKEEFPELTTTDPDATTTAYNYESFIMENFHTVAVEDNGIYYEMLAKTYNSNEIGKKIKDITLIPKKMRENFPEKVNAEVYEIKNIDTECNVAVKFEGLNEYRLYHNARYSPKTLGEMLDKLNLYENMSFGTAYVGVEHIQYEFDTDMIWKILLSDRESRCVRDFALPGNDMAITVHVPFFGMTNLSFGVSKEGYIRTNIIAGGVCFYVGKDKTQAFFNYVLENGMLID